MITSYSLSTGFSSGLQEETHNQDALHWGSTPMPEAQVESSALGHLMLDKASGPDAGHPKPKPHPGTLGTSVSSHEHCPFPTAREEQDKHSQLLQELELALHLGRPVGVVAKAVDENLKERKASERPRSLSAPGTPLCCQTSCNTTATSMGLDARRKGQGWEESAPALLASPSTWMCSRYCCWASYSRCWFFSRSSLIFMKFSKSPRYVSSRCECRWMMSVATAFRKFLSWDTTRMVDCQVWRRARQRPEHHQARTPGLVPPPSKVGHKPALALARLRGSCHLLPAGRSPATKWPSCPACLLALREEVLRSGGLRMAG